MLWAQSTTEQHILQHTRTRRIRPDPVATGIRHKLQHMRITLYCVATGNRTYCNKLTVAFCLASGNEQVLEQGYQLTVLHKIIEHIRQQTMITEDRTCTATNKKNIFFVLHHGTPHIQQTKITYCDGDKIQTATHENNTLLCCNREQNIL